MLCQYQDEEPTRHNNKKQGFLMKFFLQLPMTLDYLETHVYISVRKI